MPDDGLFDEFGQSGERRAGAWILLIVGLAGLGLGLYHVRGSIVNAFNRQPSAYKTLEELEQERVEALKTKDTDADGLSDFDETYVFKISPYLADSDSDGIADKTELEKGTNPNCPEGKDCGPLGGVERLAESATGPSEAAAAPGGEEAYLEQLFNPTPEQVRAFMREAGAKEEDLAGIDDETLLRMYREALQEAQLERQLKP
jgi:hypothetical protein